MRLRWHWMVPVVLLVAVSCSEDESTPLIPQPEGVEIKVTVSPARVVVGDPYTLVVEVTNNGPRLELDARCEQNLGYRIRLDNGSMLISSPGPGCILATEPFVLKAGEQRVERFQRVANMTQGRYIVEAGIVDHEDDYPWATAELVVGFP